MRDLCDLFDINKNLPDAPETYEHKYCPGCGLRFEYGEAKFFLVYSACGHKRAMRVCEKCKVDFKYETED
jgi:hypothetical protein